MVQRIGKNEFFFFFFFLIKKKNLTETNGNILVPKNVNDQTPLLNRRENVNQVESQSNRSFAA